MSREQWGHGYYSGIGKGILRGMHYQKELDKLKWQLFPAYCWWAIRNPISFLRTKIYGPGRYVHVDKVYESGRAQVICPFHKEMTPSCTVDVKKNTWHCFGCCAGGHATMMVKLKDGRLHMLLHNKNDTEAHGLSDYT
jgi:hypothetical protein